ncbi:MAG: ornithine carbamoyltransferase [Nanoarchaeota archaeon]|nr:ornithine carbamoyltransferase [Nanoarchaeota archaeon]MBU1005909.1 ornithine carbamoyltransferase [Nanoarchaeota archaeon]MBU1945386.1 ornithine carbamoyltransferase [Nanoarchaeota archaeon]
MNLLTLKGWSNEDIINIIDKAIAIKKNPKKYIEVLKGKTLAMLFEKTSTRTRISFEAGMAQLGGHALFLDWKTTQLGKADLKDEIKCIGRYVDIIMARVYKQEAVEVMGEYAGKPVINGLSDKYHPCQIIADLMTIKENFGKLKGLKLAYIGDGNNVCNSLIVGCKKVGMKISVAAPKGYEPLEKPDLLTNDPVKAAAGADVIYTDTWVSMGQEEEKAKRLKVFPPYQVTKKLVGKALFMHCLPAYRGYEVTDEVIDSKQSIVFDQAENRMHAQKAIILKLLGKI